MTEDRLDQIVFAVTDFADPVEAALSWSRGDLLGTFACERIK